MCRMRKIHNKNFSYETYTLMSGAGSTDSVTTEEFKLPSTSGRARSGATNKTSKTGRDGGGVRTTTTTTVTKESIPIDGKSMGGSSSDVERDIPTVSKSRLPDSESSVEPRGERIRRERLANLEKARLARRDKREKNSQDQNVQHDSMDRHGHEGGDSSNNGTSQSVLPSSDDGDDGGNGSVDDGADDNVVHNDDGVVGDQVRGTRDSNLDRDHDPVLSSKRKRRMGGNGGNQRPSKRRKVDTTRNESEPPAAAVDTEVGFFDSIVSSVAEHTLNTVRIFVATGVASLLFVTVGAAKNLIMPSAPTNPELDKYKDTNWNRE